MADLSTSVVSTPVPISPDATPTVSVMVPCYNATGTLPMALASLLAQTYTNWECIVVDDGSTDDVSGVLATLADRRVQAIHLAQNQGRGVARQVALDHARGQFLTMLDADDWLYPTKLARQVDTLNRVPEVGLCSTGIAIVGYDDQISGVRAQGQANDPYRVYPAVKRLGPSPVAHAPSMIRMELAKQAQYDARLKRSQDADFLMQVLRHTPFLVLPDVLYAYAEYRSATEAEVLAGYRYRIQMFWKYRRRSPLAALWHVGQSAAKWLLFRLAFAFDRQEALLRRRSNLPAPEDVENYVRARQRVLQVRAQHFGPSSEPSSQVSSHLSASRVHATRQAGGDVNGR